MLTCSTVNKVLLHSLGYFIGLWLFSGCSQWLPANDRPPNFIIIFTDDQGYGDLGSFGGDHVKTPRIDQMAAEGAKPLSGKKGRTFEGGMRMPAVVRWPGKIRIAGQSSPELYDLENDISEATCILQDHPEVAARLRAYSSEFEKELAENSRPAGFVEHSKPLSK